MTTEVNFEVSTTDERGVPVVAVRGEVDVATAPDLHAQLLGLAGRGTTLAVVDLTDVTFVDSTALGVLVSAAKEFRSGGGDLRLVVTEPHLAKVFTITGLDEVFAIYPTAGEAVAA